MATITDQTAHGGMCHAQESQVDMWQAIKSVLCPCSEESALGQTVPETTAV